MSIDIMPGIQLYQTEADDELLIQSAFENGCWLVPDIKFSTREVSREPSEAYPAQAKPGRGTPIIGSRCVWLGQMAIMAAMGLEDVENVEELCSDGS
jgi:hypothetical protein